MTDRPPAAIRDAAVAAHRAGKLDKARTLYVRYLTARPDDAGILSNLGALFRQARQYDMARRIQARAYAMDPEAPGIRNNYANILSDVGAYDRSIELRRIILAQNPDDAMQEAMIGRCLRGMGRDRKSVV